MFCTASICYHRKGRQSLKIAPGCFKAQIEDKYFSDGEPNVMIPALHSVPGKHVVYVAKWNNPHERYIDLSCLWAIAENGPLLLDIVIPFSGSATMERETREGELATANTDAKFLSALPCQKRVTVFDLHTLQNKFYFHNTAVNMLSAVPHLIDAIDQDDAIIVFPDEGAKKRYGNMPCFEASQLLFCIKERVGDKRVVRVPQAEQVEDKPVIVVDDLVRTGGTLLECAKALRDAGAKSVVAAVPHAVFPNNSHTKFLDSDLFDKFYTTNSVIADRQPLAEHERFQVLSIADMF